MTRKMMSCPDEPRAHRVRELVYTYRSFRNPDGRLASVSTLALTTPRTAARVLAPLLRDEPVEVFAVACLSARQRLLSWHVVSRGTRTCAPVSVPDVFVPACLTVGAVALLVLHNHPSGEPVPSPDDVAITRRLQGAAAVLGFELLDHLIVGEGDRYYSFRETGDTDTTHPRAAVAAWHESPAAYGGAIRHASDSRPIQSRGGSRAMRQTASK